MSALIKPTVRAGGGSHYCHHIVNVDVRLAKAVSRIALCRDKPNSIKGMFEGSSFLRRVQRYDLRTEVEP